MKKHNFSFDLSNISTYTDEVGGLLISESIVKAQTPSVVQVQAGVVGTQAINLLSSSITLGEGGCGWDSNSNASGTTFTQRNLATKLYQYQETLCPTALRNYWQGQFLNGKLDNSEVPMEAMIADLKVKEIQKFVEDKVWLATTLVDGFDGFYTTISTGTTGVAAVVSATTPAIGSMLTAVDEVYAALSEAVSNDDDIVCFMSPSNFKNYIVDLRDANLFHYSPEELKSGDFVVFHPATKVRILSTPGLVSKNTIVMGKSSEMVIGVNLLDETEKLDMWYSRDNSEVRLMAQFSLASNIAFGESFATNNIGQ